MDPSTTYPHPCYTVHEMINPHRGVAGEGNEIDQLEAIAENRHRAAAATAATEMLVEQRRHPQEIEREKT